MTCVNSLQDEFVKTSYFFSEGIFPLVIEPYALDVNLIDWVGHNLEFIETALLRHGAILFRNFNVASGSQFEQFAKAIRPDLMDYIDQHTPRTRVAGNTYTSTEYPPEHHIPFHSENSKNEVWPMKIWFFCCQPALRGGETPIADNRTVFHLLDPKIRQRFIEKNVMYVRNFGTGIGVPWQTAFQTESKSEVENYCRTSRIELEWKADDCLKTRHVSQAVEAHPKTGEMVWFNQAHLFHISSLEPEAREAMLAIFGEEELPSNAYYGDGSPIEVSVLDEIRDTFHQASVKFPWQQRDILMLDNMLMAHSRTPFVGERKVLVTMAEISKRRDN